MSSIKDCVKFKRLSAIVERRMKCDSNSEIRNLCRMLNMQSKSFSSFKYKFLYFNARDQFSIM
uniref:Uncharacterized protein n=1 Tax=Glossina pallidipes TaxID=7398 RepID=A0A1A9ZHD0_GLOPL